MNLECFLSLHAKLVFTTIRQEGKGQRRRPHRRRLLLNPRVLQIPKSAHLSAFILILLVPCFLSVDLLAVYSQSFPNSLSPPSQLLPHSTLWECGRRRSVGDVTLGMQQLWT